jgi:helix-turn-helix resolvase-like protein
VTASTLVVVSSPSPGHTTPAARVSPTPDSASCALCGAPHKAEFERALIKERQREGIVLAKQRGVYKGRKKTLSAAAITELRTRITAGISKAKVAREFGISRQTLYQYLQEGDGAA